MRRVTWPMVAIVALVLGFIAVVFGLIPKSDAASRSALLAVVIAGANACVLWAVAQVQGRTERLDQKVDQVVRQTNGHITTLIAAKTQPDVSRETSRPGEAPDGR